MTTSNKGDNYENTLREREKQRKWNIFFVLLLVPMLGFLLFSERNFNAFVIAMLAFQIGNLTNFLSDFGARKAWIELAAVQSKIIDQLVSPEAALGEMLSSADHGSATYKNGKDLES